ncbi:MAG: hypothetical protein J7J01_02620 [Methanophagales archaeon]|nr:hypothetical protein [Methanophagales archaeon]
MKVVVEIAVYDGFGVDDGVTKEFNSLKEALDYVFDDLDGKIVELSKDSFGRYMIIPKDYDPYVEYTIEVKED